MAAAISFQSLALSGDEVLNIVNSVVDADTPTVLATIPGGISASTTGYVALGELGLGIITQIANAIAAAHAASVAASAVKAASKSASAGV